MFMAILTLITALSISAVAIYYSIYGLAAIFAAAVIPIMIMGTVLEVGKLVTASWLYQNWRVAPRMIRSYLAIAVVVLMFITSMGIFGFLSKAHVEQTSLTGNTLSQIESLDEKLLRSDNKIKRWYSEIDSLNSVGTSGSEVRVDILITNEQEILNEIYERINSDVAIEQTALNNLYNLINSEKDSVTTVLEKDIKVQKERIDQARIRKLEDIAQINHQRDKRIISKRLHREGVATINADEVAVTSAAQKEIIKIQKKLQSLLKEVDDKYALQIVEINERITYIKDQSNGKYASQIIVINDRIASLRVQSTTKTDNIDSRIIELETFIEEEQLKVDLVNEDKMIIETRYRKLEADVGPIKYIAEFVYGYEADDKMLERAVRWVIITIIFVFDPLAVLLLIAANMSFMHRFGRGFEKQYDPSLVKQYAQTPKQSNIVIEQMKDNNSELQKKLDEAEAKLHEQLQYQEEVEKTKPEKIVINIDETANVNSTDDTEKKKG